MIVVWFDDKTIRVSEDTLDVTFTFETIPVLDDIRTLTWETEIEEIGELHHFDGSVETFFDESVVEPYRNLVQERFDSMKTEAETPENKKAQELSVAKAEFEQSLATLQTETRLGFSVNADPRSRENVKGLMTVGKYPVEFVDINNKVQEVKTEDELTTIYVDICSAIANHYAEYFSQREKIIQKYSE